MMNPSPRSDHDGLSCADAVKRLAQDGPNELPGGGHRSTVTIVLGVLREPMLLLLLGAGGVYLLLGDVHDALILLAFAGLTILITAV